MYRGFSYALVELGYDKWYQRYVDRRMLALLDQTLLRTSVLQTIW
jgi:hypothetical protein